MSKPPNLIYLTIEHTKARALSIYGNTHVSCPFFERMAADGVVFTDAYSPNPICTPSRTTVFTGVHPLVHQVTCHQNRAPWNLLQLSEILLQNGYYTAVAGHYEPDRNLSRGWHEQVDFREYGPLRSSAELWRVRRSSGIGWEAGRLECSLEEENSYLLTTRAIRMLDAAKSTKAPFFLHVSYQDAHSPYFAPPPYDTLVDPATLPLPDQGDELACPQWQITARQESGTAHGTELDIKRVVAMYYGLIVLVNDQMSRLHEAMGKRGMLENTWLIIASDHGDYTGEKGLFNQSESLYECLLHVPLLIVPPAGVRAPRGVKLTGLVDLADLFPTILRIAGVGVPEYAQGKDLVAYVRDGAHEPLRDYVFGQVGDYHGFLKNTLPAGMAASARHPGLLQGARSGDFSFVRDPDYGDEAYDLRKDPQELVNLLRDPSAQEPLEVTELRRKVDSWEQACLRLRERLGVMPGDRGFVEGWE